MTKRAATWPDPVLAHQPSPSHPHPLPAIHTPHTGTTAVVRSHLQPHLQPHLHPRHCLLSPLLLFAGLQECLSACTATMTRYTSANRGLCWLVMNLKDQGRAWARPSWPTDHSGWGK
jgi:hypothetical protein